MYFFVGWLYSWGKKEQSSRSKKEKREEDNAKGWVLLICYQWFTFLSKSKG
jgi:hypothetical protein